MDHRKLPTDYDPATQISSLALSEISDLAAILMKKKGITVLPNVAVTKLGAVGSEMVQGQSVGGSEEAKPLHL